MAHDRAKPFNDLPLLPPYKDVEDIEILKKLVTTSRALAAANSTVKRLPNPYADKYDSFAGGESINGYREYFYD